MKLGTYLASIAGLFGMCHGKPFLLNLFNPLEVAQYGNLYDDCLAGGANSYVGVHYDGATATQTFAFGECYPYEIDGKLAQVAVFCRSATCYNNPNPDCSGGAVPPVGVPLPALTVLPNEGDWVQILGQGATCQPDPIP